MKKILAIGLLVLSIIFNVSVAEASQDKTGRFTLFVADSPRGGDEGLSNRGVDWNTFRSDAIVSLRQLTPTEVGKYKPMQDVIKHEWLITSPTLPDLDPKSLGNYGHRIIIGGVGSAPLGGSIDPNLCTIRIQSLVGPDNTKTIGGNIDRLFSLTPNGGYSLEYMVDNKFVQTVPSGAVCTKINYIGASIGYDVSTTPQALLAALQENRVAFMITTKTAGKKADGGDYSVIQKRIIGTNPPSTPLWMMNTETLGEDFPQASLSREGVLTWAWPTYWLSGNSVRFETSTDLVNWSAGIPNIYPTGPVLSIQVGTVPRFFRIHCN